MIKVYIDSNILVRHYSVGRSKQEEKEKIEIIKAFETFKQIDIEAWTSMWTITELVKVLTLKFKMDPYEVAEIEQQLVNEGRFLDIKIHFADVSPKSDYDFKEFFYHIRQSILENNAGVGDAIQAIIMKNNDMRTILTMNLGDFNKIPGLTVLHPKDVSL